MPLDRATRENIERLSGLRSLDREAGLMAFERAFACAEPHVLVLHGNVAPLARRLCEAPVSVAPPSAVAFEEHLTEPASPDRGDEARVR